MGTQTPSRLPNYCNTLCNISGTPGTRQDVSEDMNAEFSRLKYNNDFLQENVEVL